MPSDFFSEKHIFFLNHGFVFQIEPTVFARKYPKFEILTQPYGVVFVVAVGLRCETLKSLWTLVSLPNVPDCALPMRTVVQSQINPKIPKFSKSPQDGFPLVSIHYRT